MMKLHETVFLLLLLLLAIGCVEQRAAQEPAPAMNFRGAGNEPGWTIVATDTSGIRFDYDYGQSTATLTPPVNAAMVESGAIRFTGVAAGQPLSVEIVEQPCADTMSDETFDFRVLVEFGERQFSGCGRAI
jgi:uncharacterized membrane protein